MMSEKTLKARIAWLEEENKKITDKKNAYEIALRILAFIGVVIVFYYFAIWVRAVASKAAIDFTAWYMASEFDMGAVHGAVVTFSFIFMMWIIPKLLYRPFYGG